MKLLTLKQNSKQLLLVMSIKGYSGMLLQLSHYSFGFLVVEDVLHYLSSGNQITFRDSLGLLLIITERK